MTARSSARPPHGPHRPPSGVGATPDLVVRLSQPHERDDVLRFIAAMGFNPRDAVTWDGLAMLAMTAWYGQRLIGAIPLEPRPFQLAPGQVIRAVHQTTVAVAPEFRSRGVGSRMQAAIAAHDPPLAPLATVFREEPASPAYRWYVRNGFSPALTIRAWLLAEPGGAVGPGEQGAGRLPATFSTHDASEKAIDWAAVGTLWDRTYGARHGGFVSRTERLRQDWLRAHPYRSQYKFKVLLIHDATGALAAYAILGIGRLHSETTRVEIMEHAARTPDPRWLRMLIAEVAGLAARSGYRPVRWAMAADDPRATLARRCGFVPDMQFDLLTRPLGSSGARLPDAAERRRRWRYHSLDYA